MNFEDEQLESLICDIKDDTDSHEKINNYKKANKRLEDLKIEYNNLCECVKKSRNDVNGTKKNISIEKIMEELDKINMDAENNRDMKKTIKNYIQYKKMLGQLDSESKKVINSIMKVDIQCDKIKIEEIELDDIL